MPRARRRSTRPGATGIVALAASLSVASPALAHHNPTWRTRCADIAGTTLALSDRWRIVDYTSTNTDLEYDAIVACDPRMPGPAHVLVIGRDDDPPVVTALAGDEVMLETYHEYHGSMGASSSSSWTRRLVDLRRNASLGVGVGFYDVERAADPPSIDAPVSRTGRAAISALLPNGALLRAAWDSLPVSQGGAPVEVLDARGRRTGLVVTGLAGTHSGRSIAYAIPAAHPDRVVRIAARGPVPSGVLKPGKVGPHAMRTYEWRTPPGVHYSELHGVGTVPIVRSAYGRTWVGLDGGDNIVQRSRLAPGAADELWTLESQPGGALVVGRFADRPHQTHVRMLSRLSAKFDIRARAGMLQPGNAIVFGSGGIAISDGVGELYVRHPSVSAPVRFAVRARHLAAFQVSGGFRIAYLDRNGQPQSVFVADPPTP